MSVNDLRTHLDSKMGGMRITRYSWWLHWRELADYILPRRYRWLVQANQANRGSPINYNIVDSTATIAARTLAAGLTAGVSSPTRPWFKFQIKEYEDDIEVAAWLAECARRMGEVFQESNFYTAMAVMYFDLVVFGTASVLIYEDYENVIHCYNPCAGEYFYGLNSKLEVDCFAREFTMTMAQIADMFPLDKVMQDVKESVDPKNPALSGTATREKMIMHMIEPNIGYYDVVPKKFPYREVYWEVGAEKDRVLRAKGFWDWPCLTPRWDVVANDPYGRSPAMDALGDTKQLQQETRRKAQAIDKMVNPPIIADIQLKNQPASLLPGGFTYVAGLDNQRVGAKPLYTVMPPIGEMKQDIQEVQSRIRLTFHNDLFTGITDLTTVRTATEIDARREEKLVLLGPVLERILHELSKAIDRTWGIMQRGGLLPLPPQALRGQISHVQVNFISMLAMAQRGLATAAIEKVWGFAGNLSAVKPEVLDRLDEDETIQEYADALGVSPKLLRSDKQVAAIQKARAQAQAAQQGMMAAQSVAQTAATGAQGAETLSNTDVGGGANALQLILGRGAVEGNA